MITVITTCAAPIFVFNPMGKTYSKKGTCFKSEGATVKVKRVENNAGFLRICEDSGKETNNYLRTQDVAEAATA